jgi:hypothetical protein
MVFKGCIEFKLHVLRGFWSDKLKDQGFMYIKYVIIK